MSADHYNIMAGSLTDTQEEVKRVVEQRNRNGKREINVIHVVRRRESGSNTLAV